jgi:hypothetical protein
MIAFYKKYFEILSHFELYSGKKQYIGSSKNRKCRYCGRSSDQTLFRDGVHAIPAFLSNRAIFTYEECDDCNNFFGSTLEDHLSKFPGLRRTMSKLKGRTGIPTYGVPGRNPRIKFDPDLNRFHATGSFDDEFAKIDLERKTVVFKTERQPYRKRSAFKALVKIALGLMPRSELQHFANTLRWIAIRNPEDDHLDAKFYCFYSVSPVALSGIDALLLKRKSPSAALPFMSFYLAFANFTYQIFLPFCDLDRHLIGTSVEMPRLPAFQEVLGQVEYIIEDLSSNEISKGEKDELHFSFSGEATVRKLPEVFPEELLNKIIEPNGNI